MSAWITDRVPTREDADHKTMVWVSSPREVSRPKPETSSTAFTAWQCVYSVVSLGTPWQPITYPEPYVKEPVWKWEYSDMNGYVDISQNGKFRWSIRLGNGVTEAHIDAMTDALNKLEETP